MDINVIFTILCVSMCVTSTNGQEELEKQPCSYTFHVPTDEFDAQCVTSEMRQSLDEIRRENKQILNENAGLRQQVEALIKDCGDMVETVKTLKAQTLSWRQVMEWPVYDTPINPGQPAEINDASTYNDCYQALRKKEDKKPGIYRLNPKDAQHPFLAYCDENGWTVFLRRFDGSQDFNRGWSDYSGGFGELASEYWLGLENIHLMTYAKDYQLRTEAMGWNNKLYSGEWDNFTVGNELDKYPINVGNMTEGNYIDVLDRLNNLMFSTKDSDNDEWYEDSCAQHYRSGWWLHNCGFNPTRAWCKAPGCMTWGELQIKKIVLKIRPMIAKGVNMAKPKKEVEGVNMAKPKKEVEPSEKTTKPPKKVEPSEKTTKPPKKVKPDRIKKKKNKKSKKNEIANMN